MEMEADFINRSEASPIDEEFSQDQNTSGFNSPSDYRDCSSVASSYQRHLTPYSDANLISLIEEFNTLDSAPDKDSESELVIDEIPPCLENALALNLAYQAFIEETLQQFSVLLDVNLEKQRNLQNTINQLSSKPGRKSIEKDNNRAKKIHFSIFGAPYFKDAEYNSPPKNDDAQLAEDLGFRNLALICSQKPLNKYEEAKLMSGVRAEGLRLKANELSKERDELKLLLLDESLPSDEVRSIELKIKKLGSLIFNRDKLKNEDLFQNPDIIINWNKISVDNFCKTKKANQLRCYWENYMCPAISKKKWTVEENRHLRALVNRVPETADWDEIARLLGTKRTAFGCFARYQSRFNRTSRQIGWKDEDNLKLVQVIQSRYDSPETIDWGVVRLHFPGRTRNQIYSHWKYNLCCADIRPFSRAEDILIVEGVKIGFDFPEISLLLGKRTPLQIRRRHRTILIQGKIGLADWKPEEDKILMSISDPSILATHTYRNKFSKRFLAQIVSRYHFLRMKQMEDPREYVRMMPKSQRVLGRMWKNETFTQKISRLIARYGKSRVVSQGDSHFVAHRNINRQLSTTLLRTARKDPSLMNSKTGKPKLSLIYRDRELREILRALYTTMRRRPRISSYPGDGREHGLVLLFFYRLLRCHFTRMPDENCEENELDELGIELQDQMPFQTFQGLINDLPSPRHEFQLVTIAEENYDDERNSAIAEGQEGGRASPETSEDVKPLYLFLHEQNSNETPEKSRRPNAHHPQANGPIYFLPTNMHSLTGFRGLLLHQKYLEKSAGRKDSDSPPKASETDAAPSTSQEADSPIPEFCDAEINPDVPFGNAEADTLMLSRIISIFYWPGIMSTVMPPDDLEHDPRIAESQSETTKQQTPRRRRKPQKSNYKRTQKAISKKQKIEGQQNAESDCRADSSASSVTVSTAPSTPQPIESPLPSPAESPPPTKKAKQADEQSAKKKVTRNRAAKATPTRVYRTRTRTRTEQEVKNEK